MRLYTRHCCRDISPFLQHTQVAIQVQRTDVLDVPYHQAIAGLFPVCSFYVTGYGECLMHRLRTTVAATGASSVFSTETADISTAPTLPVLIPRPSNSNSRCISSEHNLQRARSTKPHGVKDGTLTDKLQPTRTHHAGDETANVNFYAVRPEGTRIR